MPRLDALADDFTTFPGGAFYELLVLLGCGAFSAKGCGDGVVLLVIPPGGCLGGLGGDFRRVSRFESLLEVVGFEFSDLLLCGSLRLVVALGIAFTLGDVHVADRLAESLALHIRQADGATEAGGGKVKTLRLGVLGDAPSGCLGVVAFLAEKLLNLRCSECEPCNGLTERLQDFSSGATFHGNLHTAGDVACDL